MKCNWEKKNGKREVVKKVIEVLASVETRSMVEWTGCLEAPSVKLGTWLHLTTRSNFRICLLLGCHGLRSDASRFNLRSNECTCGDPSCKLCYTQLEDATHFISLCPLLEAKRQEQLSHVPPQLQETNLPDPAVTRLCLQMLCYGSAVSCLHL